MARRKDTPESQFVGALVTVLVFLVSLPFRLLSSKQLKPKKTMRHQLSSSERAEVAHQWRETIELSLTPGASHFRMAVMQADSLCNNVLQKIGMPGNTFADRLKEAQTSMQWEIYQGLWQAHKLRNRLAHEVDAEIMSWEAKEALHFFEEGLRELGALE